MATNVSVSLEKKDHFSLLPDVESSRIVCSESQCSHIFRREFCSDKSSEGTQDNRSRDTRNAEEGGRLQGPISSHNPNPPVATVLGEEGSESSSGSNINLEKEREGYIAKAFHAVCEVKAMPPHKFIESVEKIRAQAKSSRNPGISVESLFIRPITEKELETRAAFQLHFISLSKDKLQLHFEYFYLRKHVLQDQGAGKEQDIHRIANEWILDEVGKAILQKGGNPIVPNIPTLKEKKETALIAARDSWEEVFREKVSEISLEELKSSSTVSLNFTEKKVLLEKVVNNKTGSVLWEIMKESLETISGDDLMNHCEYFERKINVIQEIVGNAISNENELLIRLISNQMILSALLKEVTRRGVK